jgi:hypothetical protein
MFMCWRKPGTHTANATYEAGLLFQPAKLSLFPPLGISRTLSACGERKSMAAQRAQNDREMFGLWSSSSMALVPEQPDFYQ